MPVLCVKAFHIFQCCAVSPLLLLSSLSLLFLSTIPTRLLRLITDFGDTKVITDIEASLEPNLNLHSIIQVPTATIIPILRHTNTIGPATTFFPGFRRSWVRRSSNNEAERERSFRHSTKVAFALYWNTESSYRRNGREFRVFL